ncbi:MAG: glycoside hydrolase family 97 protein [Bacteroidales bacterium]|nr:glycoside hydrolase family 97 protein [Bacteroidales bacterium]MCF8402481.1 glycoside hydrolase family 97 protein [Bacteroidales bacterium]
MKSLIAGFFLFTIFLLCQSIRAQAVFSLSSPDGKIVTEIFTGDYLEFEVSYDSVKIVDRSRISMNVNEHEVLGLAPKIRKKITNSVDSKVIPVVSEKFSAIPEKYNETKLICKGGYSIVFRVYNNGLAWRYETTYEEDIRINRELVNLQFPSNSMVWFPEEESFFSHNERYYSREEIELISNERFCSLPALVESSEGIKILISESNLRDYPGMWLKGTGSKSLQATFPGVSLEEEQSNDRNVKVIKYADYLAITKGARTFPWRMLAIAKKDADLLTNQLSYLLADQCAIEDPSWIIPGKVAWDWWNAWNIYGVDFKAGVNTQTYKYYIDFASKYGIDYIIMDEGWYKLGDLLDVVAEIDMEEIIAYANQKNVGVILWVIWKTLENQWDETFDQFEAWGVKGIKVDFMQRDDQSMVNYYWRVAEEAAKRKMLVDFHGAYKPSGLRRTYPNVITREGLRGLEQSKWSDKNTPDHNLTLPFIRMVAGPMDYTPGALVNATKENFKPIYTQPMSMGTRCHQLAMYVVYESPLQMLCDNPSNYLREPECMDFLSAVPTVWDSTVVLKAKIGEVIALARKKGEEWYIGAMTNWQPTELEIDLSFLSEGEYNADIWQDGTNANRYASDFKKTKQTLTADKKLKLKLAPGGGWAAILSLK